MKISSRRLGEDQPLLMISKATLMGACFPRLSPMYSWITERQLRQYPQRDFRNSSHGLLVQSYCTASPVKTTGVVPLLFVAR